MRVIVTGGAGYIGSHTVLSLIRAGHEPVIVDNFRSSKRAVIPRLEFLAKRRIRVWEIDLTDRVATSMVFEKERPDGVIHFAALKSVAESVEQPLEYYVNNLESTFILLEAMTKVPTNLFVFSSSATVYGENSPVPMHESFDTSATNPYGWTKVFLEQVLQDASNADTCLKIAILRYFNPAGAHRSGLIGEDPQGEPSNLMPLLCQVAAGKRPELLIFGDDYPTPDGTPRRDYIHVTDLAEGHVAALAKLNAMRSGAAIWNLGTGRSHSVREVIDIFSQVSSRDLTTRVVGRRAGDVADSYADPSRAEQELDWVAEHSISDMCVDAWNWQRQNPDGYI